MKNIYWEKYLLGKIYIGKNDHWEKRSVIGKSIHWEKWLLGKKCIGIPGLGKASPTLFWIFMLKTYFNQIQTQFLAKWGTSWIKTSSWCRNEEPHSCSSKSSSSLVLIWWIETYNRQRDNTSWIIASLRIISTPGAQSSFALCTLRRYSWKFISTNGPCQYISKIILSFAPC